MKILVTGGTGFIGSRLCKAIVDRPDVDRVVSYSRRWDPAKRLSSEINSPKFRAINGCITDYPALKYALKGITHVFHTAAYKDVPTAQYNPREAIRVNIYGSDQLIKACIDMGVSKVLGISSDKAVMPVNLYGQTKAVMESLFVAANSLGDTSFAAARYGNVINSTGSVIPIFKKSLLSGLPVTITDGEMTRFWFPDYQAVDFVMWCMDNAQRGEVIIPLLKSASIVQILEAMEIILGVDAKGMQMTGCRPGEKMHEDLLSIHEGKRTYKTNNYIIIAPEFNFWDINYKPRGKAKLMNGYSSRYADVFTGEELNEILS